MPLPSSSPSHATLQAAAAGARPPLPLAARPIVVLGAGGIVRAAHLPAYVKARFPVIAFADTVPAKAAELAALTPGSRGFQTVAEAIAFAPPDAVFDVAVPAAHLLSILEQLPAGAAVLLQKPMGETLAEARAIRDLCRNRGLTAAVNFQLRYAPNHLAAQAMFHTGAFGEMHDLEINVRTYTPWQLWTFLAKAPRLEILYHSIHYLDLVRSWFGNPRSVLARSVRNPLTPQLAATKTSILLDYGDTRRVLITTNHGHDFPSTQQSFVLGEGTSGAFHMGMGVNLDYPDGRPDTLSYALRDDPAGWQNVPVVGNWFPDAFIGSMGALQCFVEGSAATLPTSFESAYETMALVEACYASAEKPGEPLPL